VIAFELKVQRSLISTFPINVMCTAVGMLNIYCHFVLKFVKKKKCFLLFFVQRDFKIDISFFFFVPVRSTEYFGSIKSSCVFSFMKFGEKKICSKNGLKCICLSSVTLLLKQMTISSRKCQSSRVCGNDFPLFRQ
jgi:hypothetical protein